METAGSLEAQKPVDQAVESVRNKKVSGLLVYTSIMSIILGIYACSAETLPEPFQKGGALSDFLDYHVIKISDNGCGILLRPSIIWFIRTLPFLAGILAFAAIFAKPLSRPGIGALVALSLVSILPLLWIAANDSVAFFTVCEEKGRRFGVDFATEKIIAWIVPTFYTVVFLAVAVAIGLGFKVRAIAPFRH